MFYIIENFSIPVRATYVNNIFAGKELKFLFFFQAAFSGDYIGRVASECSCRSSRRSFHSVHWPFPFGFRGIPFARESCFSSLSTPCLFFSSLSSVVLQSATFDIRATVGVGRVKSDSDEKHRRRISSLI